VKLVDINIELSTDFS